MQMKRTYFYISRRFCHTLHFVKIIRTFKPVVVILLRQLFYLPIVQFTTAGQLITAAVVKHDTFSLDIGIEISVFIDGFIQVVDAFVYKLYGGGCVSVLPFVVIIGGLAQDVIDNISLETGIGNYQKYHNRS